MTQVSLADTLATFVTRFNNLDSDFTNLDAGNISTSEAFVKTAGDGNFIDNVKLTFGTGLDFEIFHDGSNSYLKDNGTGDLILQTNGSTVTVKNSSDEKNAVFNSGGSVELYYNDSKKIETSNTGMSLTGTFKMGDWTIKNEGNGLTFTLNSTDLMRLDSSGNLLLVGDINVNKTI